ncbi:TraB/GumN family protein [Mangrovivirga cuniculi]|uniref:TraB/GumN family protein n=1 Tax=Mangrovivirga cuniculi TaxID=2715131 RepID=UPI003743464E
MSGNQKKLKKKDFEKLKSISESWEIDLYKLQPIEISLKLRQVFIKTKCKTVHGTDDFNHFDNYLIHLSKEKGIKIFGLETDTLQLSLIKKENNPSWKSERKTISFWINQLTTETPDLSPCAFTNRYRNFDLDYKFDEECNKDILIFQRNINWMQKIPDLLRTNNVFIAVGYLHLTRKCGLLEQLRYNGFKVEPVKLN